MRLPTQTPPVQYTHLTAASSDERAAIKRALERESANSFYERLLRENATSRANELLRQRTWTR
jgi:hypothetical protein